MKILKTTHIDNTSIQFVEHNRKKFKLHYNNRNGVPLGFDSRFKAQILKDDVWVTIAGKTDIGFTPVSYICIISERINDSEVFFELMRNHIELLY